MTTNRNNNSSDSPAKYVLDEAPTILLKFDFDRSHPAPERIIYFRSDDGPILEQIKNAYKDVDLGSYTLDQIMITDEGANVVTLDIGLLNVAQSSLRDGDKVILFSHDDPGVAYLQTVQNYDPDVDHGFSCRTEKFGPDFSNFFITVRLTPPQQV